jgi:glycosyltransferase involved in cell wall biosynthesis
VVAFGPWLGLGVALPLLDRASVAMNILILNYGQADNNSAYHILGHAQGLAARGHDVCVCVAKSVADGEFELRDGFRLSSQKTVLKLGPQFANGQTADVLHAWTPRETVRLFVEKFSSAWGFRALAIHLEDNEAALFERFTGCSMEKAVMAEQEWPKGLIHPSRYRAFLESARGVTLVHRCLEPLVPAELPWHELVPQMDFDFFSPGVSCEVLRASHGVSASACVIVFNGNDHAAAALDIRHLYEAVELLINRGRDVVLVRSGHVLPANYEGLQFRPGPRCIELGFIERGGVPEVMRMADVVIQPGDADAFNAYRLPAKIPEYLSMGKPLIMGATNIGAELAAASGAAIILPHMSPAAIADAVEQLLDGTEAREAMAARGLAFAMSRFAEKTIAPGLEAFYLSCL